MAQRSRACALGVCKAQTGGGKPSFLPELLRPHGLPLPGALEMRGISDRMARGGIFWGQAGTWVWWWWGEVVVISPERWLATLLSHSRLCFELLLRM